MLRKLFLFFIILLFVTSLAYIVLLKMQKDSSVLGVVDKNVSKKEIVDKKTPALPESGNKNVEVILENAKKTLSEITSENIGSSSSKIRKIVDELSSLEEIKKMPINYICDSVCKD